MKRDSIVENAYPLMMAGTPEALRRKLIGAKGDLRVWWRHFLALAREDGEWFGAYQPLAFLVTRDATFRKLAREAFMRFVEAEPDSGLSQEAQFHTHVVAAPLGRWAAFYDWVADTDLLRPVERRAFTAAAIAHANTFPMQQLHGRSPGFDNQVMSNAFACTAVGHVFGFKRGHDPQAQRLFGMGLAWLRNLLGTLPMGRYSGEGSAYNEQVVAPVALWSTLLYEDVTGEALFDGGLPPNREGIRGLLELLMRCVGPGGLLPPWDAYGCQRFTCRSVLTYLARRTRNPAALRLIRDTRCWERLAHPAWECDDRVWTLAWWPEDLPFDGPAEYDAWMDPLTAGALQDRATRTRVFQYWDECGGLPNCGRAEANPNALALEAHGATLLQDGVGTVDQTLTPLPAESILRYAGRERLERLARSWGLAGEEGLAQAARRAVMGNTGISNSLIFDDEDWFVPLAPARGLGEACHQVGPLQVLSSDASSYYKDRYDVTAVRRITALCGGTWCVTRDRVSAATDHRVTWQAFVPRSATATGTRVDAAAPVGVGLAILPEGAVTPGLALAPEFPSHGPLEPGATRIRYAGATEAGQYERAFCLLPYQTLAPEAGAPCVLEDGWETKFGGGRRRKIALRDAMLADPGQHPERPRVFHREFRLRQAGGAWRLRIAVGVQNLRCRINGQPAEPCLSVHGERWDGLTALAHVFDLTGKVRAGLNRLELEAPYRHGETIAGPVELLRPVAETPQAAFERLDPDVYAVTVDGRRDLLLLDNGRGLRDFAGGRTDATHAVATATATACIQATHFDGTRRFVLDARLPSDVAVIREGAKAPPTVELGTLTDNNSLSLKLPEGELRVETTGWLMLTWLPVKADPLSVRVRSDVARAVLVNGVTKGWIAAGEWLALTLEVPTATVAGRSGQTAASVYAAAFRHGSAAEKTLLDAVVGHDWEVALAATDALSLVGGTAAAGDTLLHVLEAEFNAPPDPPLKCWWAYSKMLHGPGPATPDTVTETPKGIKRWRLRRALVTALGRMGHRPAIPLLIRMLEKGADYFTLTSQIPVALARLGATEALPALERWHDHYEINTQRNARIAACYLRGEISRVEFETRIGPV